MKNYYCFKCPNCNKRILVLINPKSEHMCFSCPNCDEIYTLKELENNKEQNNNIHMDV